MKQLWVATANPKKRIELERMLAPLGYTVRSLADLDTEVVITEDRDTFAGNAEAKALPLARVVNDLAIGDDSGLCVDALDGGPGVLSARYAGPGTSDVDRYQKLLAALEENTAATRRAHFACSICLARPSGPVAVFEGICPGEITTEPRGTTGFGYDPVFVADASRRESSTPPTFAELDATEKDAISHRGKALRKLVAFLADLGASPSRS